MSPLKQLEQFHSWKLERISLTTYPRDVLLHCGSGLTDESRERIAAWIRKGVCYRCRIGKGAFAFAATPSEAVSLAIKFTKVSDRI